MFFYFRELEKEEIRKEVHKLNNDNKASQHFDIPNKIIESSSDIFNDFLYVSITSSIKSSFFQSCLKTTDITFIYKKRIKDLKDNYRPVFYRFCQSYMKEVCLSKYPRFLKIFSQKANVDLGKATAHDSAS